MKKIKFKIKRLDRFAQGVSPGEKVLFVKRALPEEEGEAFIYRKAKGVLFGRIEKLEKESSRRITPECIHYEKCNGCDYLHVEYEKEVDYKFENFKFELKDILEESSEIGKLYGERFYYRNRIQLHYDKRLKKLGFINPINQEITEVSRCLIASLNISKKLNELYHNQNWLNLVEKESEKGHFELYEKEGQVFVSLNERYAFEGFSQVNTELNEKLKEYIARVFQAEERNIKTVLDLFGGNGNLSESFSKNDKRYILDFFQQEKNHPYYNIDLDKEFIDLKLKKTDFMIIDPPRRGFLEIEKWVNFYHPRHILYVSCDISTLKRDLKKLEGYKPQQALMIDFFPGTYHYESLVLLSKI